LGPPGLIAKLNFNVTKTVYWQGFFFVVVKKQSHLWSLYWYQHLGWIQDYREEYLRYGPPNAFLCRGFRGHPPPARF